MITRKLLIVLILVISLIRCGSSFAQTTLSIGSHKQCDVVPGVLYLQIKANSGIDFEHISPTHTGNSDLDAYFEKIGATDINPFDPEAKNYGVSRRNGIDRIFVLNYSAEGLSPRTVSDDIHKLSVIESSSPRLIFERCYTPNDPHVSEQYALDNMHIKDAWGISEGNSNIIIADLDEGVNYNHEDLAANIYKINGHFGYDVVGDTGTGGHFVPDNDPFPGPTQSHGTMTSGCFGMIPDNHLGGAGSGFKCKIMVIKIANDTGYLYGGYEGIHYAVTHGAKILNCSWGGSDGNANDIAFAQLFVNEALDTGALIVAAAGNSGDNIDVTPFIPAYLSGVLTVGATDAADAPATEGFSTNYGSHVGVYAPGVNIFSTSFPGNSTYASENGTSFSCPLTAGVAGLLWAKNPTWTPKFIARQIIASADNVVMPSDRKNYWGRVNAYSALTQATVPGLTISDYSVDGVDKGGLNYLNKVYSLDVTFKNLMGQGNGVQARLLPVQGYTVQQSTTNLGAIGSLQSSVGSFKFTRDSTDNGAGSQMKLYIIISYGNSTIAAQKYSDTLSLVVNIIDDKIYVPNSISDLSSYTLTLGDTYPNPVAGDAVINFELKDLGNAKILLFDVLGRQINVLTEGMFEPGKKSIQFDARTLPNGI